ncbi:class I SAM-dependent methyltransferase [Streptomyces sp. NRRL B-24720]|uniref:class I SAM-dependent methyltransferase n=1 Tax=Streptomyces sp. NRRL B-24720 TaxID=1476876 RepID=UPI0004C4913A|nr:class I SAM-dependent methyltransferase [Streptomyces sp. NRRL B-24720]
MLDLSGIDRAASWRVLDLGGRDINGTIRSHLPKATWTGTDIEPGDGVDIVHDATLTWPADAGQFDVVVCTEVLEHLPLWRLVLHTAAEALEPGGPELLVVTCASDGRPEHGVAGAPLPAPGEWYANVPPGHVRETLETLFEQVHVEYQANPGDAYAWAQGVRR